MKIVKLLIISTVFAGCFSLQASSRDSKRDFKTSKELRNDYPNVDDDTSRDENRKILCPFHRLMERAGKYDNLPASLQDQVIVKISTLVTAAREFGCKITGCKTIAHVASLGQNTSLKDRKSDFARLGKVNVTRLHKAKGLAHDCGLTFEKNDIEISDKRRNLTLNKLKKIAQANRPNGTLLLSDIQKTKEEICKLENVKSTIAGRFEMKLIFKYLGGEDRGFVEYSDVERFLHAKMPLTKAIEGI